MSQDEGPKPPAAATAFTATPALQALRAELDGLDAEIIRLVARRLDTVKRVIEEKAGRSSVIRDPHREREVLSRVEAIARSVGLSGPLARKIFAEIIAHSVSRQASTLSGLGEGEARPLVVAYQGSPLTFNHLAVQKFVSGLGAPGELVGTSSIKDAVAELEAGRAELAFVPIENTTGGSINAVYDVLRERDLHIVGEETYKVDHCLGSIAEVPLGAIERVLSHPLALEQCSLFLAALPRARAVPTIDTAEALRLCAEAQDPTQVAIGSPEGVEAFGLVPLRRSIGNVEELLTRYVALARAPARFDARIPCKTSLILSTRHEHGALLRCLHVLSDHGLQLTKLESRPRPNRPWEYMFFIDFEGNVASKAVAEALDALRSETLFLKVLGCYPAKATPSEAQPAAVRGPKAGVDAAAPTMPAAVAPSAPGAPAPSPTPTPAPGAAAATLAPAARAHASAARSAAPYRLVDRAARAADTLVRVGDVLIGGGGFTVMAGPGSVESQEQIQGVARFLKEHGAHVLLGGVFTSRTSPYAFQGLGLEALGWLAEAGRSVGLPVATEVLAPEDVRAVAEQADILQVGARNMQNFPLLKALGKIDRPVLLKRGGSSTIDEWLAAAEYVLAEGNGQVILCERGIRTFESATRNTLDLSAVVVLRERTHLPVIVDPSHATGKRSLVAPMAWAARACGSQGLLVQVHPDPARALSHAEQSLSFVEFAALVDGLSRWRA